MRQQRPAGRTRALAVAALVCALIVALVAWWFLSGAGLHGLLDERHGGEAVSGGATAVLPSAPSGAPELLATQASPPAGFSPDIPRAPVAAYPSGILAYAVTGRVVDEQGLP